MYVGVVSKGYGTDEVDVDIGPGTYGADVDLELHCFNGLSVTHDTLEGTLIHNRILPRPGKLIVAAHVRVSLLWKTTRRHWIPGPKAN